MFGEKMTILGNIFIVEIGESQVQDNIEEERKAEHCVIHSVVLQPNFLLYGNVDNNNPKRLNKQI